MFLQYLSQDVQYGLYTRDHVHSNKVIELKQNPSDRVLYTCYSYNVNFLLSLQLEAERAKVQELEKSLKERQHYVSSLELQFREEVARSAPVFGSNLDRLTSQQLEQLARLHERGLKQTRNLIVSP